MNRKKKTYPLRALFKRLAILLLLLAYVASSAVSFLLPSGARRDFCIRNTSLFSKIALVLFGVHVDKRHEECFRGGQGGRLIVVNHISYVDVLVLSSLLPSVFITSVELKHTRLLGLLARFGGSLFVERRRPADLKQEIDDIARVLKQGFPVVLFPEGTTSNGDRVHLFKRSLFDAAIQSGTDILPVCLKYRRINGQAVSHLNRDDLYYYGGVRFSDHFPRFLSLRSVDVQVTPLKAVKALPHSSRKELAWETHEAISKAYGA